MNMCNHCSSDPRDAAAEAGRALLGLRILVNELPRGSSADPNTLAALLDLIHDRLEPAVEKLQNYIPRE